MLMYYKKKERDDLARIDYYNEALKDAARDLKEVKTKLSREDWLEALSGVVSFEDTVVNAFMTQHWEKDELEANKAPYDDCCPSAVQRIGEIAAIRLDGVRFRHDVIVFGVQGTPQIAASLIAKYYPRWYTVEVAELTKEQVETRKKLAEKFTDMSFPKPDSPEEVAELARLEPRIDFGPGYRRTLEKGKAKVVFSEAAYYEDMAKRKLNL